MAGYLTQSSYQQANRTAVRRFTTDATPAIKQAAEAAGLRLMYAKFPGRCGRCNQFVNVDTLIGWASGQKAVHADCLVSPRQQPEPRRLTQPTARPTVSIPHSAPRQSRPTAPSTCARCGAYDQYLMNSSCHGPVCGRCYDIVEDE